MKNKAARVLKSILVMIPVCALLFVTLLSMSGCTKKDTSKKTDTTIENTEIILENEGDLEISVPEDEETFGE